MKSLILILTIVSLSYCATPTTKYDNVDIDKILANERVLANYIKCLLETGPCTPEGRTLKEHIPQAIQNGCVECNPAQQKIVRKASLYVMNHLPNEWSKITTKYDPDRKYATVFHKFLESE